LIRLLTAESHRLQTHHFVKEIAGYLPHPRIWKHWEIHGKFDDFAG
jgi:hypothetical protein